MRTLHVNDTVIPLSDEDATRLARAGVLYDCGDADFGHDLHLTPDHRFNLTDAEDLALSIRRSFDSKDGEHRGLPVQGYKPTQSQEAVDLVNEGKQLEERLIRWAERVRLHSISGDPSGEPFEGYGFANDGIRQVQIGCMLLYRAVFQPNGSRISLPEDPADINF